MPSSSSTSSSSSLLTLLWSKQKTTTGLHGLATDVKRYGKLLIDGVSTDSGGVVTDTFQHTKAQDPKALINFSNDDKHFFITCEIPGPAGNDTTCNLYIGDQSPILLKTKIWKRRNFKSNLWFCQFTVTKDVLFRRLQSVRSQEVSCDYRVSSESNSLSLRSDGYIFTDLLGYLMICDPTTKQRSSKAAGSNVSLHLTPKAQGKPTTSLTSPLTPTATTSVNQLWLAAVGVASGVVGFLLGLTAICLCRKTNLEMGDMRSGGLVDSEDEQSNSVAIYENVQ
ncbi:hypothetical protein DPEC_G00197660 [Dallia pectoralis]|uniref:Uncharacterized protein n=1 Tax=Dallia pectoralis TaxID=75939 RepID=A0ACC2G888_DALPE|nr:hypothetical protein DPEC_G00197660 [Dallia pectoralis]